MIRLTLAALLLASPALADEMWDSDMGRIVYEAEEGGAALFSFVNVDGYAATLVIPGLAGNYSNRSVHEAYWIGSGAGMCDAFLAHYTTDPSADWGRALISFDRPEFPTPFTLTLGTCFGPLSYAIRAEVHMQ